VIPSGRTAAVTPALELGALGLGLALATAALARVPSWEHDLGAFQVRFAVAFLFYLVAVVRLGRWETLPHAGLAVVAVAAACRVLLLPLPPSLSGDLYRYVWEGRVWLHGGNPYLQSPGDPALAPFRDGAIWPFVNHPQLATLYPPLAEAGFAVVAALKGGVLAMKAWVTLHDLALAAVLAAWAKAERGSGAAALLYAWNPLVLVEFAGTGHNDPTAMLGLALAFFLRDRNPVASGLSLAWASLVKLAPLVALPFLWREWPSRARLACAAVLLPALAAFFLATRGGNSGLGAYWGAWRNNALVFDLLERALHSFGAARAITLGAAVVVLVAGLVRRVRPDLAARRVLGTALATSPVIHPWYAGWPLMFVTRPRSIFWIGVTALQPLDYGFLRTPPEGRNFHAPLAWRWIEYGVPLAAALIAGAVRRARRRNAHVP
jgi:hypothetical protein